MHVHKDNSWRDVVGFAGQVNEGGPAANGSNSQELLCGGCSAHQAGSKCARHGSEFTEWKCRYCCTIASFFCFGTTHMCNACHQKWQLRPGCLTVSRRSCTPISCPLRTAHPDHGHEHCLGCALCRTNDWYGHVSNECFALIQLTEWNQYIVERIRTLSSLNACLDCAGTIATWWFPALKFIHDAYTMKLSWLHSLSLYTTELNLSMRLKWSLRSWSVT